MDRSLLDAARNGDQRARNALGRWLLAELWTLYQRRRQPVPIEDLIQASVTEILSQLSDAPHDPASFRIWVLGRAGMRAKSIRRDTYREWERIVGAPLRSPAESPSVSVTGSLFAAEELQTILDHAQRLRPIYHTAIMHFLDGGNYKSLAASEGIAMSTAYHRVSRAVELVQRSIEAHRRTRPRYRTPKRARARVRGSKSR
jgi:DNA-directed RNA polymerase specialized sigma24 family protein